MVTAFVFVADPTVKVFVLVDEMAAVIEIACPPVPASIATLSVARRPSITDLLIDAVPVNIILTGLEPEVVQLVPEDPVSPAEPIVKVCDRAFRDSPRSKQATEHHMFRTVATVAGGQ